MDIPLGRLNTIRAASRGTYTDSAETCFREMLKIYLIEKNPGAEDILDILRNPVIGLNSFADEFEIICHQAFNERTEPEIQTESVNVGLHQEQQASDNNVNFLVAQLEKARQENQELKSEQQHKITLLNELEQRVKEQETKFALITQQLKAKSELQESELQQKLVETEQRIQEEHSVREIQMYLLFNSFLKKVDTSKITISIHDLEPCILAIVQQFDAADIIKKIKNLHVSEIEIFENYLQQIKLKISSLEKSLAVNSELYKQKVAFELSLWHIARFKQQVPLKAYKDFAAMSFLIKNILRK